MTGDPLVLVTAVVVGANVALALVLLFRRDMRWAMAAWTVALFFTPVYASTAVMSLSLAIVDVIAIIGVSASLPWRGLNWSLIDTLVVLAFAGMGIGVLLGAVPGHLQDSVISWLIPYIWGRVISARISADWLSLCITMAAVTAAILAVIEFATRMNIFVGLPGTVEPMWRELQYRGGVLRAEGAFGHSIALGATLAASSPFVLAAKIHWALKSAAFAVVAAGVVVTLSRIGLVALVLVIALSVVFLGRHIRLAHRVALVAVAIVAAMVAIPFVSTIFDDAGDEAQGSAEYRGDLLGLVSSMRLLGVSSAREVLPTGVDYYGGFRSIDSALILTGLRHGVVPLLLFIAMMLVAAWVVSTGRGTPAAVATVSLFPALATVALITQYASFLWFVAGVAVTSDRLSHRRRARDAALDSRSDRPNLVGAG